MIAKMLLDWLGLLWEAIAPALPALITSFFSVLVGALPFMVVAAFASGFLEVFVSRDAIARLVPRNGVRGILLAPLLGLCIPMCECGIVPVARRMVQKGVPGAAAVTFMLSNPIMNPLAVYATYLAFPWARYMVWLRVGLAYVVAVLTGLAVHAGIRRGWFPSILNDAYDPESAAAAECCGCGEEHGHDHPDPNLTQKLQAWLEHAASEFFDVSKYFIIGSALAAISQALISRQLLEAIGGGPVMSVLIMIAFAYVICICSEADAFVAATFASTFTPGALLAFLVAGPMTDIKNTMMMASAFRRPFVIFLNVLILGLTAAFTIALNFGMGV